MPLQSFKVNFHKSKLVIYIKILIFTMLLFRDQKKLSIPLYPKQMTRQRDKTVQ